MFDVIRFRNFKCLAAAKVELGRLTLLVGANAAGKSSVLDGLHLVCQLARPHRNEDRFTAFRGGAVFSGPRHPSRLQTHGTKSPMVIAAERDGRTALSVAARPPEQEAASWRFQFEAAAGDGTTRQIETPGDSAEVAKFFRWLDTLGYGYTVRLRLDATCVAAFAPDSERPRVEFDGSGTAAVLAWLAEQRSPALVAIEEDVRRVVPRARRLMPERASGQAENGSAELGRRFSLELENGDLTPADLLSEGTLLTIGLLTVLHRPPVPRLVLLDDFDRALHPAAQRQLVAAVKQVLERDPELQIVCTTHSPYVLDLFDAADVRVLRADSAGRTRVRKLTEHPEWTAWKDTMKAGEFWSYVGEDWLDAETNAGG